MEGGEEREGRRERGKKGEGERESHRWHIIHCLKFLLFHLSRYTAIH